MVSFLSIWTLCFIRNINWEWECSKILVKCVIQGRGEAFKSKCQKKWGKSCLIFPFLVLVHRNLVEILFNGKKLLVKNMELCMSCQQAGIQYTKYQFSSYREWTVYVDAGFAGHCVNNWFVTSLKLMRVILPVTLTETRITCDTGLWNVSGALPWLH